MKILLIAPPITRKSSSLSLCYEPLALAFLEAYLTPKGFQVDLLDTLGEGLNTLTKTERGFRQGLTDTEISERLATFQPDVIGISCNISINFEDTTDLAALCKERFPHAPIVLGGAHGAIHDILTLDLCSDIDYVIRGEGEVAFHELLQAIQHGTDVKEIHNLTYRCDGKIVQTPRIACTVPLDELPFPNRGKLLMDAYFQNKKKFSLRKGKNNAMLITSRGCPFHCRFCVVEEITCGREWRPFPVERTLEEILDLYHNYGVREISIVDNNFIVQRERVMEIMDGIIRNDLRLHFTVSAGMSMWLVDRELLLKMRKAGLYWMNIPIESGAPDTLKYIRKKIDLERARELIRTAKRIGLWTKSNFIIGFPYESKEHILETKRFAISCGVDYAHIIPAKPMPGTDLRKDAVKEGLVSPTVLPEDFEAVYTQSQGSCFFTAKEIEVFREDITRSFVRHRIVSILNLPRFCKDLFFRINSPDKFIFFLKVLGFTFRTYIFPAFGKNRLKQKNVES